MSERCSGADSLGVLAVSNEEALDLVVLVLDEIMRQKFPALADDPCWEDLVVEAHARWDARKRREVLAPF